MTGSTKSRPSPFMRPAPQVATLTVGGRFDVYRFGVPAVMLRKAW
jgi:hypothetical protein